MATTTFTYLILLFFEAKISAVVWFSFALKVNTFFQLAEHVQLLVDVISYHRVPRRKHLPHSGEDEIPGQAHPDGHQGL